MSRVNKLWLMQWALGPVVYNVYVYFPTIIFMQYIYNMQYMYIYISNVAIKFIEHLLFNWLKINLKIEKSISKMTAINFMALFFEISGNSDFPKKAQYW